MYIIYVDFVLKNKITIKKLGITFRKLSAKERKFLIEQTSLVTKEILINYIVNMKKKVLIQINICLT